VLAAVFVGVAIAATGRRDGLRRGLRFGSPRKSRTIQPNIALLTAAGGPCY